MPSTRQSRSSKCVSPHLAVRNVCRRTHREREGECIGITAHLRGSDLSGPVEQRIRHTVRRHEKVAYSLPTGHGVFVTPEVGNKASRGDADGGAVVRDLEW
jgi:hypothetical protein